MSHKADLGDIEKADLGDIETFQFQNDPDEGWYFWLWLDPEGVPNRIEKGPFDSREEATKNAEELSKKLGVSKTTEETNQ